MRATARNLQLGRGKRKEQHGSLFSELGEEFPETIGCLKNVAPISSARHGKSKGSRQTKEERLTHIAYTDRHTRERRF